MYMGESDSTASQPPKPGDWILGRAANDVKEKTSRSRSPRKPLLRNGLAGEPPAAPLWKTCFKPVNFAPFSVLTGGIVEAYLLPRSRVIMAFGSSVRPIFRARIRR